MRGSHYRYRDYVFGQLMLTLRTRIGLTQAALADLLGVSRRAVGDWEAGSSYPKTNHLKQFIAVAIKREAFQQGHEREEACSLWQSAGQKVLLDEAWLSSLLAGEPPVAELSPVSQAANGSPGVAYDLFPAARCACLDWDNAPTVQKFYGREWELNLLAGWVVEARCRVVSVLGLGGIGKSALAVRLMHRVAERFEGVIWRSLRDLPSYEELLEDLLQVLAPQALGESSASLDQRQSALLSQMRSKRILIVLDNLDSLLWGREDAGRMCDRHEGFGRFLHLSAETEHQSCVLLTSREKPDVLVSLEGCQAPIRAFRLDRLDAASCEKLLAEKGLISSAPDLARLIETYTGNPLALKIVAQTIVDLFGGEISLFLEQGEVIFGGVRILLEEQFNRLSRLEQSVLLLLAILREPSTLNELLEVLVITVPRSRLLEALDALYRHSLIKRGQKQGSFALEPVIMEYLSNWFPIQVSNEIQEGKPLRLIEHSLESAQGWEDARHRPGKFDRHPSFDSLDQCLLAAGRSR